MQLYQLAKKDLSFTPYSVQWIPSSSRLCSVGGTERTTGKIAVYAFEEKQLVLAAETEISSPVRCATFGAADTHNRHAATGDFKGGLQLWDTQRLELSVDSVDAHDSIIHCIDGACGQGQSNELVTGSRDTTVKVWDTRQLHTSVFSVKRKDPNVKNEVWSVAFAPNMAHRAIAIGYDNGCIRLFDIDAGSYLWETQVGDGVCSLTFDQGNTLIASTLTGVHVIDLMDGKASKLSTPSDTTYWCVQAVPQYDQHVSVTAGDGSMSIWHQQQRDAPLAKSSLTTHPVISHHWHPNRKGLFASSAFDQTLRIGYVE
ncbi:WD40 repeat-like protein [Hesseltinella vesiculosa]|uniref:WD40 repeat-like protein n=1 Tax=Hesseltinella vesiculosa TaxID=101127 RepID=A0A1X2GEN2_9FUNG|nr:WD40 repeat-like protein [Hesseltinella vesiculosa]